MERLTKRSKKTTHENGVCCTHFRGVECIARLGDCSADCPWEEAVWNKLAKYEDLEEQCIAENQCGIGELLVKWKAFFDDIAELYEYRKAEEQGLLLRLPCRVGDTVYVINRRDNLVTEEKVRDVQYRGESYQKGKRFFMNIGASIFFEDEFGKLVFFDREEAKSALAKKGGVE